MSVPPYNPQAQQGPPETAFQYPAMQLPELGDQELNDLFAWQKLQGEKGNLARQYQMANALRENAHKAQGHSTGLGAAFAGIGDLIDSYRAGRMLRQADKGMDAMPGRELEALRGGYNQARKFQPYGFGPPNPMIPPTQASRPVPPGVPEEVGIHG